MKSNTFTVNNCFIITNVVRIIAHNQFYNPLKGPRKPINFEI